MGLKVTRPKPAGESRYIDYLPDDYCFKVSHTFNPALIEAFKEVMPKDTFWLADAHEDRVGHVGRRWWKVKMTRESCVALLKWGIQSDYRFTERALLKLDEISKAQAPLRQSVPPEKSQSSS